MSEGTRWDSKTCPICNVEGVPCEAPYADERLCKSCGYAWNPKKVLDCAGPMVLFLRDERDLAVSENAALKKRVGKLEEVIKEAAIGLQSEPEAYVRANILHKIGRLLAGKEAGR